MSNINLELPDEILEWPFEDILCELGAQSGLSALFDDAGHERLMFPHLVRDYRPPGPYPEAFYRAQKWLRRNLIELQRAIIEKLDYGAKREGYLRNKKESLARDLANVIAPLCNEPYPVEPLVAAAVVIKIGLDKFCMGYDDADFDPKAWSLERALGIDPFAADKAAAMGNKLLMAGNWTNAIPHYEEALSSYALHLGALNDLAHIYATYIPEHPKGLEYARRVLRHTFRYDDTVECTVRDTVGWSVYRHAHNLDRAEVHLRKAIEFLKPGDQFYPTVAYHLIAVLEDAGRHEEAKCLFETFSHILPANLIDDQSVQAARSLIGLRGRVLRFFKTRILPDSLTRAPEKGKRLDK